MKIWHYLFILVAFMVIACSEQESESIVSLGSEMSATEIEKINNLDKASYAELAGIIKDNRIIDPEGKYLMIIFGVNGCLYCDQLKKTIKNSDELQNKLKDFSPYYINFSYIKPHQFVTNLTPNPIVTTDLVQIYRVGPTPMIVFANQNAQTIFTHTGATSEAQLLAMLDFVVSQEWKGAKSEQEVNTKLKNFLQERLK